MRGLTGREKRLLLLCFLTIFVIANFFAGRAIFKELGGGESRINELKSELDENNMYLEEKDLWDKRRDWLNANMLPPISSSLNAQGELAQTIQNGLFERKIKIERQSLLEPVTGVSYEEVAVNFRIKGDAAKIAEWLSTLQSPENFYVIKNIILELDTRSKETEPQANCNITVARWFTPKGQLPVPPPATPETPSEETPVTEPPAEPGTEEKPDGGENGKVELTER